MGQAVPNYYAITDEEFTVGKDNATAWQEMIVPWADVVPYTFTTVGGATTAFGLVQFSPGAQHPYLFLFCTDVNVKPITYEDLAVGDWKDAKVRVTYGPQKYDTSNDKHIDIHYTMGTEQTPIPAAYLQPVTPNVDNLTVLPSDTKDFPRTTIVSKLTVSYPFQPILNPAIWSQYIGNVSTQAFPNFLPNVAGWGQGQVLMVGVDVDRQTNVQTNSTQWTYSYEFWIREDPNAQWNSLLNDQTGNWIPIVFAKNGNTVYPTADLNQLFTGIPNDD